MNTSLAITISPPCRMVYEGFHLPLTLLYLDDINIIRRVLDYSRIRRFIIYPEFDKKGRLHYHGIIELDHNEKVRFYKCAMHKLKRIGFIDIKNMVTFEDKLKWTIYISKEWGFTKSVLELKHPMLPDHKKGDIKSSFENTLNKSKPKNIIDWFYDAKEKENDRLVC